MMKLGKAIVYANILEETAKEQIINIQKQPCMRDSKIRIMPDVHSGKDCVIGFTANIKDKIIPNLVGCDIGCGVLVVELGKRHINLKNLDNFIHNNIPNGNGNIRNTPICPFPRLNDLYIKLDNITKSYALCSIGTLGSGNHFIEIDKDDDDNLYLLIHSGSRYLGQVINKYYNKLCVKERNYKERKELIEKYKAEGREQEIESALKNMVIDKDILPYLSDEACVAYLHDMEICQDFARINRNEIGREILNFLNILPISAFHTVHNYISFKDGIMRKGAVSAHLGEKLIIPVNMRDGAFICTGKGNPEWNYSAPHGAGRIMSRARAKEILYLKDFQDDMKDIYTTCINKETIDESPAAYKSLDNLLNNNIQDTINIEKRIRPIYNFKGV